MIGLAVVVVAVLVLITGIKGFTSSGISLSAGKKLDAQASRVAGSFIMVLAVAMIWFAVFGLEMLVG